VNILDVIAPYVALKRSGPVWKGLCPFHSEKTPSFTVNPDRGGWYCFGQCATGGDAFKFLEKIENLSFWEALERLARMAGITLTENRDTRVEVGQRERLYLALEAATSFYQEALSQTPHARQYLFDRGVTQETQNSFRLGYAPEDARDLPSYLNAKKIDLKDAVEAGVVARGSSGPYDKMLGRIVCPILDVHDRPIAFGGRLMQDVKDRPKYLNTAETPLFSKGRTFFAMSRARRAMADKGYAVVVEGYFDVISAHQAGFENVVATLGTSLTSEHADMLARHVSRGVLAFDADAAGLKAAQRASAVCEAKEFEALVLDMPQGEDPDSLLRAGRTVDFQKAIDSAVPIREFQLRALVGHYQSRVGLSERDKAAIFRREIMPLLRSTQSVIERERYIRMAAPLHPFFDQGSALAEEQIRQEIDGAQRLQAPTRGAWRRERTTRPQTPITAPRQSGLQNAEENILRGMISEDETISKMVREGVTVEMFVTPGHREMARRLLNNEPFARILQDVHSGDLPVDDPIQDLAARLAIPHVPASDTDSQPSGQLGAELVTVEMMRDSLNRLRIEHFNLKKSELRRRADEGDIEAQREFSLLARRMHPAAAEESR
jgi:DNA primase